MATRTLRVQPLTRQAYAPFGWVLGVKPALDGRNGVDSPRISYWHEHDFAAGEGGAVEVLWVEYRHDATAPLRLESHRLTEQAFIPVAGEPLIHVVCPPPEDPLVPGIQPDLERMVAFLVERPAGVCMRRGCWHTQMPLRGETIAAMLTRRSTTLDLLRARHRGGETIETAVRQVAAAAEIAFEVS